MAKVTLIFDREGSAGVPEVYVVTFEGDVADFIRTLEHQSRDHSRIETRSIFPLIPSGEDLMHPSYSPPMRGGFKDSGEVERHSPEKASEHHYNFHSRTFPMSNCAMPECQAATARIAAEPS